ncbi:hypothetical protein SDC9_135419 [bioreactor metagenome]|uniref:Uncharacterized protein n=1 Tax=bioreactor metagenome TaxID=1076179 RepID=A0A645DGC2_9ZZZZ
MKIIGLRVEICRIQFRNIAEGFILTAGHSAALSVAAGFLESFLGPHAGDDIIRFF